MLLTKGLWGAILLIVNYEHGVILKSNKFINKVQRAFSNPSTRIVSFIILFAIAGTVALLLTKAAVPSLGVEAESGTLGASGGASKVSGDSTASGGGFVRFGAPVITGGGCGDSCPVPIDLPDTNYGIPAGSIFVSPSGSDSNSGSQSSPYLTITKAVSSVGSGGTIVLRGGAYREKITGGKTSKVFTLQAYPHEKPWVDGSTIVTGWTNDTNGSSTIYRHDSWSAPELCRTVHTTSASTSCVVFVTSGSKLVYTDGYTSNLDGSGGSGGNATAGLVDQVFIQGAPMTQVTSKAAVTAGKFYVDVAGQKLYVGDNPASKTVESTVHDYGLWANSSVKVMGVGFRKFASAPNNTSSIAALTVSSAGALVKDSVVIYNSATGIIIGGSNAVIDNVKVAYNGMMGGKSDSAQNLVVKNSTFSYNNTEGFQSGGAASVASGLKITNTGRGVNAPVVQDSVFAYNNGLGLWFDVSVDGGIAVRNIANNNTASGIFYEISKNGIIASNRAYNNHTDISKNYGSNIQVISSNNVQVYNNTTYGSSTGIGVYYDGRNSISGISVINNVMADVNTSRAPLEIQDASSGGTSPVPTWITAINGNVYRRSSTSSPTNIITMQSFSSSKVGYANSAAAAVAGYEVNGNDTTNSIFSNPGAANFSLTQSFAGVALPANIASLIGVGAGGTSVGYLR